MFGGAIPLLIRGESKLKCETCKRYKQCSMVGNINCLMYEKKLKKVLTNNK